MTFLNPAVLFGLIAASIPILIHLLNLRKLKRIEFSTLMFLKELQKNKIRKIKLKQWLLLAIRILIILFIVTAFARPALKGLTIGGSSSSAKTTAIFIFDDTFSMEVVDGKGSFINQAKNISLKILNQLQEGDDAAILLVSDELKNEIKLTKNLVELKKQINDISSSAVSGNLNSALVKAASLIGGSKNFNKEIYLISDFQKSRLSDENSFSNLSRLLNEKVRLFKIQFQQKEIFNAGIDNIKINNQIFQVGKTINISAKVSNYSNRKQNNFVVSLFVQGERAAQKSVELDGNQSKEVVLETIIKTAGFNDVCVEIEDDELMKDNRRYSGFIVPENISLLMLYDFEDDTKFIELAVKAGDESNIIKIEKKNFNQLSNIELNKFDVVFVIGTEGITNSFKLLNYLKSGKGIFLMPGSKTSLLKFQNICSELKIPQPKTVLNFSNQTSIKANFEKTDLLHPLLSDIFEEKSKTKIESPEIFSYFQIFTSGVGKNIISLTDNSSFFSEYKIEKGNLLLLSSAPILAQNNFPLKSIFVPIIFKSAYYLSSKASKETSSITGKGIFLSSEEYSQNQLKAVYPDKSEEIINLNEESISSVFSFINANTIGNYKFLSGSILKDFYSVNADERESNLNILTENDFNEYLAKINFKGKLFDVKPSDEISKAIKQARFGLELWKYFLILALIIALIEMYISRSAKKDLVELN